MKRKNNRKRQTSSLQINKKSNFLLSTIPGTLPSLTMAYVITQKVSEIGFDWPNLKGVLAKMDEEMDELREALLAKSRKKIREEVGDLLFVLVNLSRFCKIDPEDALGRTIEKFISRFGYIEATLLKKGKTIYQSNLMEMDQLWEEAKRKRKR